MVQFPHKSKVFVCHVLQINTGTRDASKFRE